MNYMGIDIGTSSCKAAIFNRDGQQLVMSNRNYDVIFSNKNTAELNSEEVINKCFEVIKECNLQVGVNSVGRLAISSQGEAFTAVGFGNETLCNAMVSSDMKSRANMNSFLEEFGEKKLYNITGHTAHPMFTLFKLLWLKENRKEVWEKTKYFLCFEDLLQFRMGLEPAISWSLAGRTMMFDVRKHEWDAEILKGIGISKEQLAKPLPSGYVVGEVDSNIVTNLGLAVNTLVISGGHDQSCGALGTGVVDEGVAMYAVGTVECIAPIFNEPIFSDEMQKNNLCTYNYTMRDKFTTVAFSLTGGNILKWFRDEFGMQEVDDAKRLGVDTYELLLKNLGNKPTELLVLPYFTATGTPYFDTSSKGIIAGLRLSTNRSDIIRSLLEGVAFEMRLNLDILQDSGCKINELRVVGGGSKSIRWIQLKADVIGKKITLLNITEAGCCGAAMLACASDTKIDINELSNKWVKAQATIYPIPENKRLYDERFQEYKLLYKLAKEVNL